MLNGAGGGGHTRRGYSRKPKDNRESLIEFVLYNHKAIENAICEARLDIARSGNSRKDEISRPTENAALRNLNPLKSVVFGGHFLKKPERWMEWRKVFLNSIQGVQADIVRSRYDKKQNYTIFCIDNSISQATYQNLLKDVRCFGVMIAIEMGLISVIQKD